MAFASTEHAPAADTLDLDVLIAGMTLASVAHAVRHQRPWLLLAAALLGAGTEFGAIRFGGTHCHSAGLVNFAPCSSANSVLFYVPWIYTCVVAAERLAGQARWALPWLCGALTFGMCGVYEMQGPNMRWWRWPHAKTGLVVNITRELYDDYDGLFESSSFWRAAHLDQGDALTITPHAGAALEERVWDVRHPTFAALPVMAPYFDMAFGWGVGFVLWLAPSLGDFGCVLLGAPMALAWDLPVRAMECVGVSKVYSVPLLMSAALLPLLPLLPRLASIPRLAAPDWLLFSVNAANALYFSANALLADRGTIPLSLKLLVFGVAACSLTAHGVAAGVLGSANDENSGSHEHKVAPHGQRRSKRVSSRSASPSRLKAASATRARSMLDRLQQDAQANELEPANTQPVVFLLLVLAQTLAVAVLCQYLPANYATVACFCIASHWLGFVFSVIIRSNKWFDVIEDIAYACIFVWAFHSIVDETGAPRPASARQQLVFGLAALWIARLLAFLAFRIVVRGSDFRFDKLATEPCYCLFGWTSGGTWCFLNGFCMWHVAFALPSDAGLDCLDCLGVSLFCAGLALETIADVQKFRFNAAHASGTHKKWIQGGVWAFSRHPNYCGEISVWLGLSLTCVGGCTNVSLRSLAVCLVSPLWSCMFLVFTSLMLLEKRADNRWGHAKAYQQYKLRTPVLFPLLT